MKITFIWACLIFAFVEGSFAQNPEKLKMPGPDVQNLMLGSWSTQVKYEPTAKMPNGGMGSGTEIWRPGPGGLSVIEEYHERNQSGDVEGLGVAWWDAKAQGQRFVWCENSNPDGCYVSKAVAKWDGASLVWKEEQENAGKVRVYTEIFKDINPNSFTQVLQEGEPGEAPKTTVTIRATKISETSMSVGGTASGAGQVFRDCPECPAMVVIPGGSFTIGSPANEKDRYVDEEPRRQVSIRRFAVGKFDITRGEWAVFVSATKRDTPQGCTWTGRTKMEIDPIGSWRNLGFLQDDRHPVVCVTWNDAQDYVHWLCEKTGKKYRLLSESEWEYAARAGTETAYPWGEWASHEYANYGADNWGGLALGRDKWVNTSPVGSFPPNAFGLLDMHGNVLQWVQDCFAPDYSALPTDGSAYQKDVQLKTAGDFADMSGTSSCAYRRARGGDWGDPPMMIRSAARNYAPPSGSTLEAYRSGGVGFRVARTLE